MEQLQIFNSQNFGQVRTVNVDERIHFVASDIAKALGYTNPSKAINDHCRWVTKRYIGVKTGIKADGSSAIQDIEMNIIPEGDVYRLVARSELPKAQEFEIWIFDKVLPSIRKTGGYVNDDDMFISTYLPFADDSTKEMFKGTLQIVRKQNEQIQTMQPKAEYFDTLVERNLLTSIRDTAKELKVKERKFITWLLKKYCFRDNKRKIKPYAQYCPKLFELKEFERNGHAGNQTLITPMGRETFRLLLIKDGLISDKFS